MSNEKKMLIELIKNKPQTVREYHHRGNYFITTEITRVNGEMLQCRVVSMERTNG